MVKRRHQLRELSLQRLIHIPISLPLRSSLLKLGFQRVDPEQAWSCQAEVEEGEVPLNTSRTGTEK
jgi:hypothetical protein